MPPTKDMLLSSPDPLGMSNGNIQSYSPTKANSRSLATPRGALTEASGNAQVQEFYINTPQNPRRNATPMKSPRQTTQSTSPWRIRLTVQAEQVDEMQKVEISPVKRLTERTTTITVPLKGGDDTPSAVEKKGRGRPRKSLDSPVKRAGTPKPKVGRRRKSTAESPKKHEVDAHSGTATPPKKPRGRPRKATEPKDMGRSLSQSQKDDLDVWLGSSLVDGEDTAEKRSKVIRTRSRGRRQEITPMKISVDSDIESSSSLAGISGDVPQELAWTLGNRHDEDQMDLRSVQSYEALKTQIDQSSVSGTSGGQPTLGQQDEKQWGSMIHRETSSPNPHCDDAQYQTKFDQTGQHQEYDSILESEGFSMVSVSSLPSVGEHSVSPPEQYGSLHEHTPTVAFSPSVPPAPETAKIHSSPRQLEISSDGTPKIAKVVRAGIALQGALSPKDQSQKLGSPFQESLKPSPFMTVEKPAPEPDFSRRAPKDKSPEKRSDDLFQGFGPGTRRELKAGLRLGEELAKRQRHTSQESVVSPKKGDGIFHQTSHFNIHRLPASDSKECYSLKAPGSGKHVTYPLLSNNQLPSPERSLVDEEEDRMSWKGETPIKHEELAITSAQLLVSDESIGLNTSAIDYTLMARKEEWQREREAVSKQIEMANKSQVIVIDSDGEEEEEQDPEEDVADSDIWQAEAQSADQSREMTPEASDILQQPEVFKPRRSKLPSPWRRNSQVIYSDEVEPTDSDLFWRPDQSQARASQRRNARKGQTQGHSDMSADSVLDCSLDNTRKAEAQIQREASKAWPVEGSLLSNDEDDNPATFAERTLDHGSIQHADQTIKSPVVVLPSENHTELELPPSPKEAFMKDVTEVSEENSNLRVTEGMSVESISRSSKGRKAAIDPRLLHKKIRPSSASNQPIRPIRPIQPLQLEQPSTSWLSRLTAPIWSVFVSSASLPPAATKEDILCSSLHEPLCQLTPWEECHFRALGPLYYGSLLYGAHLFPFNPRSPSARFCGAYVTTKLGWSRKITPEDCGITDAFMVLLDERGFALGEPGARWIDEGIVIAKCVALWVGMIKRGEIEIDSSKGERVGLRDQGDRKWTKDDIDWASNESAYFERKRREFDGLPSWKKQGLVP